MKQLAGIQKEEKKLEAGFGKAEITPGPEGGALDLRILGYWHTRAMRYGPVRDALFARAAAFRSGQRMVCVVALDMIGDAIGLTAQVRERIGDVVGFPGKNVMVTFTHAHTAPETIGLSGHPVAPDWTDLVADRAAEAVRQAAANMQPCRLVLGEGRLPGVAVNRSARDNAEAAALLAEGERKRFSMLDETVRVAAFRREDGELVGTLFSFACHPVCVQTQGFISADWPGAALRRLEAAGPAVFLNGACGDADPVQMRSYESLEWTGGEVARKVEEILACPEEARPPDDEAIAAASRTVRLRRRDVGSLEELQDQERALDSRASSEAANGPLHEQLFDLREKLALARLPGTLEFQTQAIRLGPLTLVGIPGEVVACLADDIRKALPGTNAWVAAYANGYAGYVVSELSFRTGAYEAAEGRWSPLAPGEAERLRDEAIQVAGEVIEEHSK